MYYKITVVNRSFAEYVLVTANCQHAPDVLIHVAPSNVLRFHQEELICIALLAVLRIVIYEQKSLIFLDAFSCYKQKRKVASFKLVLSLIEFTLYARRR